MNWKNYECENQMSIEDFLSPKKDDDEIDHKPIPYVPKMNKKTFAKCPKCGKRVIEYSKDSNCQNCGWELDWSWWGINYYTTNPTEEHDCSSCRYGTYSSKGGACNYPGSCVRYNRYSEDKTKLSKVKDNKKDTTKEQI